MILFVFAAISLICTIVLLSIHCTKQFKKRWYENEKCRTEEKLAEVSHTFHKYYTIIRGKEEDTEFLKEQNKLQCEMENLRTKKNLLERKLKPRSEYDCSVDCLGYIAMGVLFSFVVFLLLGICFRGMSKEEVKSFAYQKEAIEETIINGSEAENIAITQTIIEKNEWLSNAKAKVEIWGRMSLYYGLGVEELEPIEIKRE